MAAYIGFLFPYTHVEKYELAIFPSLIYCDLSPTADYRVDNVYIQSSRKKLVIIVLNIWNALFLCTAGMSRYKHVFC